MSDTNQDAKVMQLAATLPEVQPELLDVAKQAVAELDAAVRAGDDSAVALAKTRYDAVVWKLNGGTFFGCDGGPDAPAAAVGRHCAAVPGAVPLWGQNGEFLIEVEGIRAVVRVEGPRFSWMNHFEFHAIDPDTPFISETGYRSHFARPVGECTVDDAAALHLRAILAEKGRVMIEVKRRPEIAAGERFPWVREVAAVPTAVSAYVEQGGQFAFAF
jgi:hypothetical protein